MFIWCYYVMLSSGMITNPFFIFPENFTHSRLDLRRNFFGIRVIEDWNRIPANMKSTDKSENFKAA